MVENQVQKDIVLLFPQSVTNGATATANLDCKGHDYVTIRVPLGTQNTNGETPKTLALTESDDTVVTNFVAITGGNADAHGGIKEKVVRFDVDLRKRKRFLKLTVVPETNDTNDSLIVAAVASFNRSKEYPANTTTTEYGDATPIKQI